MARWSDEELFEGLKELAPKQKKEGRSARDERVIAGFEEIQQWVDKYGRIPLHGEALDIFERLYAVRLDRIREQEDCRNLLLPLDHQGLLAAEQGKTSAPLINDDELARELGGSDITELRHVRPSADKRAAEEIANRAPCKDFDQFEPLFEQTQTDLSSGAKETRPFSREIAIEAGEFFILGGLIAYVAERGTLFRTPQGEPDARLRVIYSNGTESNLLMRSLQRALYKDEDGRRVVDLNKTSLFGDEWADDDISSGTVYVLRSQSDEPFIAEHRELIHKIGVTGGSIETRISSAKHDATYLLAEVDVVATYKLANINRTKLENLFHRLFGSVQISLTIEDRFGYPVQPREWFLVPLHVIDEAVKRIVDGTITSCVYDPQSAQLVKSTGDRV